MSAEVIPLANAAQRVLSRILPGFFNTNTKHNYYVDFGYPELLDFDAVYRMYLRNGVGRAAVDKTAGKTWQENPFLLEKERDGSEGGDTEETELEKAIREHFDDLRVWQKLKETDMRSLVGGYAGLILRIGDGLPFNQPVGRVTGGLAALVEVIPAWAGQLKVSQWDSVETSPTYGQPLMFSFNEADVNTGQENHRQAEIHPDRVIVWSPDGTVHNKSRLEPGFNDLTTIEKVVGAGGEGFWKNAKSAPVLEMDKDLKLDLPKNMTPEQYADAVTEKVDAWNQGFDKLLMLKGIQAKALSVQLPSPEHFFNIALQCFAASFDIPLKILVGNQTGERASTEDQSSWSQTNMSRRANIVIPNIMLFVNRLERFGIVAENDWFIDWADLTEATMAEKIERAAKMAEVNQKLDSSGEWIFTPEEIRKTVGYEKLADAEAERDDPVDEAAALGVPAQGQRPTPAQQKPAPRPAAR